MLFPMRTETFGELKKAIISEIELDVPMISKNVSVILMIIEAKLKLNNERRRSW